MASNFNKVWSFGCSFMYGTTIVDGDPEYVRDTIGWGAKIGEYLDKPAQNCAVSGYGNQQILNEFFSNLPDIKPNDLVIVSWSSPHRYYWPQGPYGSINYMANFDNLEIPSRLRNILELYRERRLLYPDDIVLEQLDHILLIQETCKNRGIKVLQNNALVDVTLDIDIEQSTDWLLSRHLQVDTQNFWCYNSGTLCNLLGITSNTDPMGGGLNREDMDLSKDMMWSDSRVWHHPSIKGHDFISKTLSEWILSNDSY